MFPFQSPHRWPAPNWWAPSVESTACGATGERCRENKSMRALYNLWPIYYFINIMNNTNHWLSSLTLPLSFFSPSSSVSSLGSDSFSFSASCDRVFLADEVGLREDWRVDRAEAFFELLKTKWIQNLATHRYDRELENRCGYKTCDKRFG